MPPDFPLPIPIDDPLDPRLDPYRNLKDAALRRAEFAGARDLFIAESALVVRALLASSATVVSVLCTPGGLEDVAPDLGACARRGQAPFPTLLVSDRLLLDVVGFGFHRGVLACGSRQGLERSWHTLARDCSSLTILEGLSNHDNVGGVFRNVAALGGPRPGVLLGPGCCDPLYRKSLRVSIGHVLRVPFAKLDPAQWPDVLAQLAGLGWTVVAMTGQASEKLSDVKTFRAAILLGAEGPGLSDAALAHAGVRARIPMAPGVDSLNVAVAGAIALAQLASDQREQSSPPGV